MTVAYSFRRSCRAFATLVPAAAGLLLSSSATAQTLVGVMYRNGGQTAGVGTKLYDIDTVTGAATNPRTVNVNFCVGVAISPAGVAYGLTDQLGRINNTAGTGGKNLLFTIDLPTGLAAAVGRVNPDTSDSGDPLAVFEGDLAFDLNGNLWGITQKVNSAVFFLINRTTGLGTFEYNIPAPNSTPIGAGGLHEWDVSGMAFDNQNTCWLLDTTYPNSPGNARLHRLNLDSGLITSTIPLDRALGNVAGMAFHPVTNVLYIADGDTSGTNNLYRFDPANGALVLIGATGAIGGTLPYRGLAGLAFTPVPAAPTRCQPADIADDAGNPLPSAGPNNGVNEGDYNAFFNTFFNNQSVGSPADIAYDDGTPLPPFGPAGGVNNGVNEGDYNAFFNNFFNGCP